MTVRRKLAFIPLSVASALLFAQAPKPHRPPKVQFVEVEPHVRLEVLDWGGKGRPVVFLPGLGDTAHVYDQLARKLTDAYHVYGVTRRGFGASSVPRSGYTADRLADDVLHVLDSVKLERPVLAGHSVAGEELSSIGARRSDRIAGLIYLDAAWDRTYVPPKEKKQYGGEQESDFAKVGIPEQPKPVAGKFDPADEVRAGVQRPDYGRIRVPALALYAAARSWAELMPGTPEFTDDEKRKAAGKVVESMVQIRKHMAESFRTEVAGSRVVEIPGASHYLFRTNETDVLREIRTFLESLD